ncbi:GNAT family N-acetyltransferase [Amycolatopsis benzoatilytica]|uniref:GNAT family N-acetyltransferase n=1 Tax=Amycolatopsis benzoatilytica TaxID=346045 RepID=UPI0003664A26|nr:GNAT family N-acetyltransferase [Amycolatopsis benzoatilytica]
MTDRTVRILRPDEHRAAWDLFRAALHVPTGSDEDWARVETSHQAERGWGVFEPDLIGTARSFDAEIVVPGGALLPVAAVTGVGVRAGRTRRGVLTALQHAQLNDQAERGVPLALLHASEGAIYGRYGYGVATLAHRVVVDRHRARLRPDVPAGGEVEVLGIDEAAPKWPELYAATGMGRLAAMTRPELYWPGFESWMRRQSQLVQTAVHRGPDGVDGYLTYHVEDAKERGKLEVQVLHYSNPAAFAGLWRFLLSVDLVDEIVLPMRPLDEPSALLFADPRMAKTERTDDESWLRLVDVQAALAGRAYGSADPVVIEVEDRTLPANDGRYRISPDGAERTGAEPALRMSVDTLAMLYFGTWHASALAATGRIELLDPAAAAAADELFETRESVWCGTFF